MARLEKTTRKKHEGLSRLLECIRSMPGSQTPQLAKQLKIPAKTIERWIRELKQKGAIEYRGSKKTGGYYVA